MRRADANCQTVRHACNPPRHRTTVRETEGLIGSALRPLIKSSAMLVAGSKPALFQKDYRLQWWNPKWSLHLKVDEERPKQHGQQARLTRLVAQLSCRDASSAEGRRYTAAVLSVGRRGIA